MNATSLMVNTAAMKVVVEMADAIILKAVSCVELCDQPIGWDTSHRTFLSVLKNMSLNIVEGEAVDFVFTVPTSTARCWISEVDPFILAEALREISVEMRYAVFDIENDPGLAIRAKSGSPFTFIVY